MTNFLRSLFAKKPLTKKLLAVEREFYQIMKLSYGIHFWINWYGAYEIAPRNVVFWICIETDLVKDSLSRNKDLETQLRSAFTKFQYPAHAIPFIYIGFESQETVNRESGGNWHHHFK